MAAATNRYQCAATSPATAGVKYKPSAQAITSCPADLPPLGAATSALRNFPTAIASSGPIIHGSGARSALNKAPLAAQMTSAFQDRIRLHAERIGFIFRR